MFDFISSEALIDRVEKSLSSFNASGYLDAGDFYTQIKYVLMELNIPSFSPTGQVLKVIDAKTKIPENFNTILSLWEVERKPEAYVKDKVLQSRHMFYKEEECAEYKIDYWGCETVEKGEKITTKYYLQDNTELYEEYCNKKPLTIITKDISHIDKNCFSCKQRGNNEVYYNRNQKTLKFSFNEGWVYFEYNAFELDDEGLPSIPNTPKIEKAIESYLKYQFFQEAYTNNYFDALQRMQYWQNEYNVDIAAAKRFVSLPEFRKMVSMAEKVQNRWSKYNYQ